MPLAAALLLLLSCSREPAAPDPAPPTIVLLSWDTTRADALSCYAGQRHWRPEVQGPDARTPTADALAAGGVRFAWALAHAPTTLSSHTSVMSGRDPHGHRVPRNGFPVPADLPLLAERLAAAGWDRLAVVGASTLSADMGLDRGFRVYDDQVRTRVRHRFEERADVVTDRALALVDQRRQDRPLFLFVHYFDPHSPWDSAPAELRATFLDDPAGTTDPGPLVEAVRAGRLTDEQSRQARAAYLAEVTWTDQQAGRLLDGLRSRGLLDDALVVLLADHGEALDDPGLAPYGHSLDADLPAIHVPLILHGTGRFALPAGTVVDSPVRLLDVGSTVLSAAGLPGGPLGEGQDLAPLWRAAAAGQPPPATPPSFAEATKPIPLQRADAWNNLPFDRSVAHGEHFLTATPWEGLGPRLYRLGAGQPAVEDPAAAAALTAALAAWDAAAPGHREEGMSRETEEGLRALGYVE